MPTKIEWCEETWNPVVGCSKCSPGCTSCYAEKMARRLAAMGYEKYQSVITNGRWNGTTVFSLARLPKKPSMIFVSSMGDLFHENVADDMLFHVFDIMSENQQHTYILLTKRPKRMAEYINKNQRYLPRRLICGVTVCNQKEADEKIPQLVDTHVNTRLISIEPMLGPIDLQYPTFNGIDDLWSLPGINWVIVGGESGPGARPMHPDWVRSIRDQCKDAAVPFLFKQWGEWTHTTEWAKPQSICPSMTRYMYADGEVLETGKGLLRPGVEHPILIYRAGKKRSVRLLDGKLHDEYPKVEQ